MLTSCQSLPPPKQLQQEKTFFHDVDHLLFTIENSRAIWVSACILKYDLVCLCLFVWVWVSGGGEGESLYVCASTHVWAGWYAGVREWVFACMCMVVWYVLGTWMDRKHARYFFIGECISSRGKDREKSGRDSKREIQHTHTHTHTHTLKVGFQGRMGGHDSEERGNIIQLWSRIS